VSCHDHDDDNGPAAAIVRARLATTADTAEGVRSGWDSSNAGGGAVVAIGLELAGVTLRRASSLLDIHMMVSRQVAVVWSGVVSGVCGRYSVEEPLHEENIVKIKISELNFLVQCVTLQLSCLQPVQRWKELKVFAGGEEAGVGRKKLQVWSQMQSGEYSR
jgi:hypothetical protein